VASWLVEYCNTRNFGFPVLVLKHLHLENYLTNFDENCKLYSKEVLVIKLNGIINSDKFGRGYDDLYFGVTFVRHSVYEPAKQVHRVHKT